MQKFASKKKNLLSLKKAFNFVTSSQDSQDLQHQNI